MKPVHLGDPPYNQPIGVQIKWIIDSLRKFERASHEIDTFNILDAYTVTNLTEDRSFDADSTSVAELADIIGTMISDHKKRGSKGTT